ncbi:MAG: signal peptidase I [Planctomycetaceae bacterium]|nr:signal peptidase I [Planctomycetaceae bacterium]
MIAARSQFGSLLGWCMLVIIGQQLSATWLVERYQITSGSMAPTLLGVHCHLKCSACNREYDIGLDQPPRYGQPAYCPECGAKGPLVEDQTVLAGDQVYLDRSAFLWRDPQRWEVVAFRSPQRSAEVHVKRVVGLPGETVEIRHGDLYINGKIPERTLEQICAMSILVHDATNSQAGETDHGPRWKLKEAVSGWEQSSPDEWRYLIDKLPPSVDFMELFRSAPGEFALDEKLKWAKERTTPDIFERIKTDWLVFENRKRVPHPSQEAVPSSIDDNFGYNQTVQISQASEVTDVRVSMKMLGGSKQNVVTLNLPVEFSKMEQIDVTPEGNPWAILCGVVVRPTYFQRVIDWAKRRLPQDSRGNKHAIEIVTFDKLGICFVDGIQTSDSKPVATIPSPRPISFESWWGCTTSISDLRVYRDIYFTSPVGLRGALAIDEPFTLGPDEFFVLGDNSELAVDSRYPLYGPVRAKLLVGKLIGVK